MSKRKRLISFKLYRIGLSVEQFVIMFVIAILILLFVQLTSFQKQKSALSSLILSNINSQLEQGNAFIDSYIDSCEMILRMTALRTDLFDPFVDGKSRLVSLSDGVVGIYGLYVQRDDGVIISSNQTMYNIHGNSNIYAQIELAAKSPNKILWSEPYYSTMAAATAVCVSYCSAQDGGTVALEVNLQILYQNLMTVLRRDKQSFILLSPSGKSMLFDKTSGSVIQTVKGAYPLALSQEYEELATTLRQNGIGFSIDALPDFTFVQSNNNRTKWLLISVDENKMFTSGMSTVRNNFIFTMLFGFCMIGLAIFLIVYFFTKPIRELARKMEQVSGIDSLTLIETYRSDEVGRLTDSYNHLVKRIHLLMEDVKDAEKKKATYEFKMLQCQISPHFLHNILSCIASLIRQNKMQDAESAIKSLSGLLSYSFDGNTDGNLLSREIEGLGKYMEIQQMRYGSNFDIAYRINGDIGKCHVLKLTLQPLVENSILHGLSTMEDGQQQIFVRAYKHHDDLILLVADNGCGVPPEIQKKIINGTYETTKPGRFSSVGIANIHERLRLHYGNRYGITIRSKTGVGTVMRIKLPATYN